MVQTTIISISPLEQAYKRLVFFCTSLVTETEQTAAVQAFEYTYELSWKTARKVLIREGVQDVNSPRAVFRESARLGMIADPEIWFTFITVRNLTSHTYNDDVLHVVVTQLPSFQVQVRLLITALKQRL